MFVRLAMKIEIQSTEEKKCFGEIKNGTYFYFDTEGEIFIKTNNVNNDVNAVWLCKHTKEDDNMLEFCFHELDVVNICKCETSYE